MSAKKSPRNASAPHEAVLVNFKYDRDDPLSDEISVRYSDAKNVCTQRFIAKSTATYASMGDMMTSGVDPEDAVFMRFVEQKDDVGKVSRALCLHTPHKQTVVLYDDKNLLPHFKKKLDLWNGCVVVLTATDPLEREETFLQYKP